LIHRREASPVVREAIRLRRLFFEQRLDFFPLAMPKSLMERAHVIWTVCLQIG